MILERYRAGTQVRGQKVIFRTELFGKEYFWMQDIDGTIYLAKVGEFGEPVFA